MIDWDRIEAHLGKRQKEMTDDLFLDKYGHMLTIYCMANPYPYGYAHVDVTEWNGDMQNHGLEDVANACDEKSYDKGRD